MSWIIGGVVVLFIFSIIVNSNDTEKQNLSNNIDAQKKNTCELPNSIGDKLKNYQKMREYVDHQTLDLELFIYQENLKLQYLIESANILVDINNLPYEIKEKFFKDFNFSKNPLSPDEARYISLFVYKHTFVLPNHNIPIEYYEALKNDYLKLSNERLFNIEQIDKSLSDSQVREEFLKMLGDRNLEYLRPIFERPSGKKISDFSQFFEVIES